MARAWRLADPTYVAPSTSRLPTPHANTIDVLPQNKRESPAHTRCGAMMGPNSQPPTTRGKVERRGSSKTEQSYRRHYRHRLRHYHHHSLERDAAGNVREHWAFIF